MRTLVRKPKAVPQTACVESGMSDRPHYKRIPKVSSVPHLQHAVGNQALQDLLEAHTKDTKEDSTCKNASSATTDLDKSDSADGIDTGIAAPGDEINNKSPLGPQAQVITATLADCLSQTRGTEAASAIVVAGSTVADRHVANAVTVGRTVHLSSGFSQFEPSEQQRILAHEAVHVAQHLSPGPSAPREALEIEANELSSRVLSGHPVQPRFHAGSTTTLADDGGPLPNDLIAVRKAKARREVLLRYKVIYEGSGNIDVAAERQKILEKRERLDDSMSKRLKESEKISGRKSREAEDYREKERMNLAVLNTKPVTIEVTTTAIRIRARFQVRFEGLTEKEAAKRFPVLKQNFQQGVRDIWNQKLEGAVLPGRTFELVPELNLVSGSAARDENFWLITVRESDKAPMVYGKTSLGEDDGVPTSVTDPTVGGGVMSIPSSHIGKPAILGHETLHLFGLVDRYLTVAKLGEFGLRDTRGRQDPLGADEETGEVKGKILEEDLGFVMDQLGVYPKISYNQVLLELEQVEKIITTGRDPNSLIRKRQDFDPEMSKQVEDLP